MTAVAFSSIAGVIVFTIVIVASVGIILVRPSATNTLTGQTLFWSKFINHGRFEQLVELALGNVVATDKDAWSAIGGVAGLCSLLLQTIPILGILQAHVHADPKLEAPARALRKKAWFQLRCTAIGILEAVLAPVLRTPHVYGRLAAEAHMELSFRVQTLCFGEDTPECVGNVY